MSCRTGLLRGGRSLRDLYIGLGGTSGEDPPVGRHGLFPFDQQEDLWILSPSLKGGQHYCQHKHAHQQAAFIRDGIDHWIFIELTARGHQPEPA
jgi:hypothetical protein